MLIGRKIKLLGDELEGVVVDETKNTLLVKTQSGLKRVIKDGKRFIVNMSNKEIKVYGSEIRMRPWEYVV